MPIVRAGWKIRTLVEASEEIPTMSASVLGWNQLQIR